MATQWKHTVCPYDCPTSCGFLSQTDGARILKIKGDPDDPSSGGLICGKMRRYETCIHSPARLLTPMKRIGRKGEGRFAPISWAEAVGEITTRWKSLCAADRAQDIGYCYYSGVMSAIQRGCGEAFFGRLGASRLITTLCSSAKGAGYSSVMGQTGCLDPRELEQSDYLLVWGSNMAATRLQTMPALTRARKQGKKVVLIEAYAGAMAPFCDEIYLLRPGTDSALALALAHLLTVNGQTDEKFLSENADGWPAFRTALSSYTPQWASQITGLSTESIISLAAEFGRAKAPVILLGSGNSRYGNGGMTVRLITILSTLTGAWQRGGGLCGCSPTGASYLDDRRIKRPDFRVRPVRSININQLASALNGADGSTPLKSLYVYAGNPANSVSNQSALYRALERDDLFTVVHERFMTDTTRYADILLPATFSVEQSDFYKAYGYCTVSTARKIIPPAGECKSNWETFRLLACAMGFEDPYFSRSEDAVLDDLLAHPTPALAALSPAQQETLRLGGSVSMPFADHCHWQTPTGRIQIFNPTLTNPLPCYLPCYGGNYPLRLISVPSRYTLNSVFSSRRELVKQRGAMTLILHPDDARARSIHTGDIIKCYNDLAEVLFQAEVSNQVARGAVAAVGVFNAQSSINGLTANALHHERLSDMGESTTMNDNTVEVCLP